MIPHKLTLRNFMCYRDDLAPLHFDGMSVVCLSGENGAGKSAVLDAMTWALWGKARAKSDDELIALGQDEMEVDFEFILDGALRRVIRRRTRGKRGHTIVDFQLCDESNNWRRVGGDSVRDTDAHIAAALRMNYDTFINSAFLLQGRADEFTNRKPAERKQVLADILGLAEYEALEERAKQRRAKCDQELDGLEGVIQDHERQVERRPFLLDDLTVANNRESKLEAEVAALETLTQEQRKESERLRQLADARAELDGRVGRHVADLHELQQETAAIQLQLENAETTVARRGEIEAGVAVLRRIEARLAELDYLREEAFRLNDEKVQFDNTLKLLRNELELKQQAAMSEAVTLRERAAALVELRNELAGLQAEADEFGRLHVEVERLRAEQLALSERSHQISDVQREHSAHLIPLNAIKASLMADQSNLQQAVEKLEARVGRVPTIERDLQAAQRELLQLQAVEDQAVTLREEIQAHERDKDRRLEECAALEKQGKEIAQKLKIIETGQGLCPVCDQELPRDAQQRLIAEYQRERDDLRARFSAAKKAAGAAETGITRGHAQLPALEQQLARRAAIDTRRANLEAQLEALRVDAATLRERQLTLDALERQLAANDFGHEERKRLRELDETLTGLGDPAALRRELDQAQRAITAHDKRLRGERDLQQRMAAVRERGQMAAAAAAELPLVEQRLAELARRLDREEYGEDERAASQRLLDQIHALGYTRAEHNTLKEALGEHQSWDREMLALEQAEANLQSTRQALARSRELVERRVDDLHRERTELAALDVQLRNRQRVEMELAEAERGLRSAREQHKLALNELGRAKADLDRCDQVAAQLAIHRTQQAALRDQRGLYDELAQAFGKKGIQAMLIETAIPELEQEANALLSRMTDNQMHLSFETQRDSKKGDTLETLDIRIADGLGTRDYALFSGGEAFRVNFAVRVALSKLLARRANANLKTLVIDEGFGTQDGRGRDRIVEAINAVSADFERILIITHIQELKDLFPQQIEVTKGPAGSYWTVV